MSRTTFPQSIKLDNREFIFYKLPVTDSLKLLRLLLEALAPSVGAIFGSGNKESFGKIDLKNPKNASDDQLLDLILNADIEKALLGLAEVSEDKFMRIITDLLSKCQYNKVFVGQNLEVLEDSSDALILAVRAIGLYYKGFLSKALNFNRN